MAQTERDILHLASPYVEFRRVSDEDVIKARLFNRSRLSKDGCWEWTGAKRRGYGLFACGGKSQTAHRVSYEVYHGGIPAGMVVRHTCDNPACINPGHLLIGTVAENVGDRELRGRRNVKGEQIGTSKLTKDQVFEILASPLSNVELADKYGVHKTNIWAIRAGKSWKHLNQSNSAKEMNHGR